MYRINSGLLKFCYLIAIVCLSTLLCWVGFVTGVRWHNAASEDIIKSVSRMDALWYLEIVNSGYFYRPKFQSSVAFFPAYPAVAWSIQAVSRGETYLILLYVSNFSFFAALLLVYVYGQIRTGILATMKSDGIAKISSSDGHERTSRAASTNSYSYQAIILCAFTPLAIFFHLAYSESLFLLISVIFFILLSTKQPLFYTAAIAGLLSAVRPVGIAAAVVLFIEIMHTSQPLIIRLAKSAFYGLVACWGLVAYMCFQWYYFNEPLAFAKTQSAWRMRSPENWYDQPLALLSLEPLWSIFDPYSLSYWGRFPEQFGQNPLLNIKVLNALFFAVCLGLLIYGIATKAMTRAESTFSFLLLLIPYITRAYEMCLHSQARFCLVNFPLYFVAASILSRLPLVVQVIVIATLAVWQFALAACFAYGYVIF